MKSLADHGLAFRFNGIPFFDEDGEVEGFVNEPKWAEAELTLDHWNELAEMIAEDAARFPEQAAAISEARHLYLMMEGNGVEHAHLRGKAIQERRPAYGYECAMCLSWIVAKDPGDYPFHGGPAHGRWIVTDGRATFYVPVVPPIGLASMDADVTTAPTMSVAVYVRDGERYIYRD